MIGLPAKIGPAFMMQIKPMVPRNGHMVAAGRHCRRWWV